MNPGVPLTGDWAIDRLIRCRIRFFSLALAWPISIASNPQRVGIQFITQDIPAEQTFSVVKDGVTYPVYTTDDTMRWPMWTMLEHGELPTFAWELTSNPSAVSCNVIEYILPEDVLHMLPDSLVRK
jgi:hypothetical protein